LLPFVTILGGSTKPIMLRLRQPECWKLTLRQRPMPSLIHFLPASENHSPPEAHRRVSIHKCEFFEKWEFRIKFKNLLLKFRKCLF
jgi:hypothetical protein